MVTDGLTRGSIASESLFHQYNVKVTNCRYGETTGMLIGLYIMSLAYRCLHGCESY